jgi:hypothetical protein
MRNRRGQGSTELLCRAGNKGSMPAGNNPEDRTPTNELFSFGARAFQVVYR